jgi:hemerythrin
MNSTKAGAPPYTAVPTPASIWSDEFLLGFALMDEVHKEFIQFAGRLLKAPQAELSVALDEMAVHLDRHFGLEDKWMRETEFPPRDCHIDEHAAVMKSVREVQALLASADENGSEQAHFTARSLAVALQDWFPGHATHLDSALSHWMCKQRHGGKPVVLRRR